MNYFLLLLNELLFEMNKTLQPLYVQTVRRTIKYMAQIGSIFRGRTIIKTFLFLNLKFIKLVTIGFMI